MKKLLLILATLSIPAHAMQNKKSGLSEIFTPNAPGIIHRNVLSQSITQSNDIVPSHGRSMNQIEKNKVKLQQKPSSGHNDGQSFGFCCTLCCVTTAFVADQFIANTYMLNAKSHETMAQYYLQ